MPHSNAGLRQCSPDGTQFCLNADRVPSLVIKSGSVQSRGRLQVMFAKGFIWPGEIAWSSAIPVVKTAIGWHMRQQTWPLWEAVTAAFREENSLSCELSHIPGRSTANTLSTMRIATCSTKGASNVTRIRFQPYWASYHARRLGGFSCTSHRHTRLNNQRAWWCGYLAKLQRSLN